MTVHPTSPRGHLAHDIEALRDRIVFHDHFGYQDCQRVLDMLTLIRQHLDGYDRDAAAPANKKASKAWCAGISDVTSTLRVILDEA